MSAQISDLPESMRRKTTVTKSGCWEWTGARNSRGYGSTTNGAGGSMLAHRRSYELLKGEIPDGLTIDHLCFNKPCVNPDHMEPVTFAENTRRALAQQTHCKRGHLLAGDNLHIQVRATGNKHRVCRECTRRHSLDHLERLGLLRPSEARALTGIAYSGLRQLARSGDITAVEISGQNFYERGSIDAFNATRLRAA